MINIPSYAAVSHPAAAATPGSTGSNGTGTTGTGGTGSTGSTGSASSANSSNASNGFTLGGTDFLTLMLAQLKNQDPTSPVDSNEFLSQLASLSEVQGITQLNTQFTSLSNSLVSSQALQASALLGHQALVQSSTATLATAGAHRQRRRRACRRPALKWSLNISNSAGVLVDSINLGAQSAGTGQFQLERPDRRAARPRPPAPTP